MTRNEFIAQINELVDENDILRKIEGLAHKVLNSGCLDIESINRQNYTLAKSAMSAILEDIANDFKQTNNKKDYNNIKKFL